MIRISLWVFFLADGGAEKRRKWSVVFRVPILSSAEVQTCGFQSLSMPEALCYTQPTHFSILRCWCRGLGCAVIRYPVSGRSSRYWNRTSGGCRLPRYLRVLAFLSAPSTETSKPYTKPDSPFSTSATAKTPTGSSRKVSVPIFPSRQLPRDLMSLHMSRDILRVFEGTLFQESIESLFEKYARRRPQRRSAIWRLMQTNSEWDWLPLETIVR